MKRVILRDQNFISLLSYLHMMSCVRGQQNRWLLGVSGMEWKYEMMRRRWMQKLAAAAADGEQTLLRVVSRSS